jgi:transposase
LSDTEIRHRLTRLRNLEQLHIRDRKQIIALKARVRQLEQEKADDRAYFEALLSKQAIQIAELQAMVFGKKRRQPPTGTTALARPTALSKQPRTTDSYRRPVPPAEAVTTTETVALPSVCPHCDNEAGFARLSTRDRYLEDVPLPELTPGYQAKLVTKYLVERGVCTACGKAVSGCDLGGAVVSLGPNVRLLVADLTARLGMSYTQTAELLLSLYGLRITDGELANLLQKQHEAWLPAYGQLKASIRASPAKHYDETPWRIQAPDNNGYAWCMGDVASPAVAFVFANSRGAVHAKALHGDSEGVRITDNYSAYRALPGPHQLCWAHLYRKARDLANTDVVPDDQKPYVADWRERFEHIYAELRSALAKPYNADDRDWQAEALWLRTKALSAEPVPPAGEPDKLTRLKAELLRAGKDRLFTCLTKDTPCDNNRAERDLRQLVLKRKRSFGSKTQRGANALSTILSICTTTWRRLGSSPAGYYLALSGV